VKSSRQQGGSVSHLISARSTLGVIRLNRAEFTISHQGLNHREVKYVLV